MDSRSRACGIGEAAQQDCPNHTSARILEEGQVEGARRLLTQVVILGVFDDADDFNGDVLKRPALETEAPAQRVLSAKEVARHSLVNDRSQWRAQRRRRLARGWLSGRQPSLRLQFLWAEVAPLQQRNAHRREVLRPHPEAMTVHILIRPIGVALDYDIIVRTRATQQAEAS